MVIEAQRKEINIPKEAHFKAYEEYATQVDNPQPFNQIMESGGFSPEALASLLYQRLLRVEAAALKNRRDIQELPGSVLNSDGFIESSENGENTGMSNISDQTDVKSRLRQRSVWNLSHHPPETDETMQKHERVRGLLINVSNELIEVCPECEELAICLRKVEEVGFWANGAIARNQPS